MAKKITEAEIQEGVEVAEKLKEVHEVELHNALPNGETKLVLDFSRITGRVLLKAETETRRADPGVSVMALSQHYQARVAAAAAHVKLDDILDLKGDDFTAVTLVTQNFLVASGR